MTNDLLTEALWVEKYRPQSINDVVLPNDQAIKFKEYISKKSIPHLLFYGGPGSGKSTIARIITSEICGHENDLLEINGSSMTSVDTVRNTIESFCRLPTINSEAKIVYIDEFDYMSNNAQACLRGVLNDYYENSRFIFTLNHYHKVMDAIKSRCQNYEFKRLPREYIKTHVKFILESEKVKYTESLVDNIISMHYPDVRRIIGVLSKNTTNNELIDLKIEDTPEHLIKTYIFRIFCVFTGLAEAKTLGSSIAQVTKVVTAEEVDYVSLYKELFRYEDTPIWCKIILAKYSTNHSQAMLPELNFMACVYEMIEKGRMLLKATNVS